MSPSSGELQEVPCGVEGARRKDLRAGAGEGRDPATGGLVSARLKTLGLLIIHPCTVEGTR